MLFKIKHSTLLLTMMGLGVCSVYAKAPTESRLTILQQANVCKGVVNDANGEPVIGATVLVKGNKKALLPTLTVNFLWTVFTVATFLSYPTLA